MLAFTSKSVRDDIGVLLNKDKDAFKPCVFCDTPVMWLTDHVDGYIVVAPRGSSEQIRHSRLFVFCRNCWNTTITERAKLRLR